MGFWSEDNQLALYLVDLKLCDVESNGVLRTASSLHIGLVQVCARPSPPSIHQLLILADGEAMTVQAERKAGLCT